MTKRIHISIFITLLFTAVSCSNSRRINESPKEAITEEPTWVNSRPNSLAYYIGIGVASKTIEPTAYTEVAKKNAFHDLVSEISVHVKGETLLQTMEVDLHFREQFSSMIQSSFNEHIEGFERLGTWEDKESYWVYYRLSKAEHDRLKKEMKDMTLSQTYNTYQIAQIYEEEGKIVEALNGYLEALKIMERYWGETNLYEDNGSTIYLDQLIYRAINDLTNKITIRSDKNTIVLNSDNQFIKEVTVEILSGGKPVIGIPITYAYDKGNYMRKKEIHTNSNGIIKILVKDANIKNRDNYLGIELNFKDMILSELKTGLMSAATKNIRSLKKEIPIDVTMPKIYIAATEKNLGQRLPTGQLSETLENDLRKNNFRIVTSESQADYLIELSANTTSSGTSQGFHVSHLSYSLKMMEATNMSIVYQTSESSIKGLQLNFRTAGLEAYKKARKNFHRQVFPTLLETAF